MATTSLNSLLLPWVHWSASIPLFINQANKLAVSQGFIHKWALQLPLWATSLFLSSIKYVLTQYKSTNKQWKCTCLDLHRQEQKKWGTVKINITVDTLAFIKAYGLRFTVTNTQNGILSCLYLEWFMPPWNSDYYQKHMAKCKRNKKLQN